MKDILAIWTGREDFQGETQRIEIFQLENLAIQLDHLKRNEGLTSFVALEVQESGNPFTSQPEKYNRAVKWLRRRYAVNGWIEVSPFSRFSTLERAFWNRYMPPAETIARLDLSKLDPAN